MADEALERLIREADRLGLWMCRTSEGFKVAFRDRYVETRVMRGSELRPHPKNPRRHPASQVGALTSVLESVGKAGALLVYKAGDGVYTIIDGECRSANFADEEWRCLVVDVTDEEAEMLLATHDPLAAMAETDRAALEVLLADLHGSDEGLNELLSDIAFAHGISMEDESLVSLSQGSDRPGEIVPFIAFEGNRFQMSTASAERLRSAIAEHVAEFGSQQGFADRLVNGL